MSSEPNERARENPTTRPIPESATVRSANQEWEALPVTSDEKGALSIARRRRPSWQAEWAIRHGERTKVAIAEPSYATLACVGYRAKTGKHLLAVSWQFGPQHDPRHAERMTAAGRTCAALRLVQSTPSRGLKWPLSPPGVFWRRRGGLPWSAGDATYNTQHHRPLPTDGRGSPTRSSGLTGRVTERLKPGLAARCPRINSTSVRA